MKCPNCKSEMTRGALSNEGFWSTVTFGLKPMNEEKMATVFAYKCPTCGKIELQAEPK